MQLHWMDLTCPISKLVLISLALKKKNLQQLNNFDKLCSPIYARIKAKRGGYPTFKPALKYNIVTELCMAKFFSFISAWLTFHFFFIFKISLRRALDPMVYKADTTALFQEKPFNRCKSSSHFNWTLFNGCQFSSLYFHWWTSPELMS